MTVNLVEPDLSSWGPLITEVYTFDAWPEEMTPEVLDEVIRFYDEYLIPELVCIDDGPDRPTLGWIGQVGRRLVVAHTADGSMVGCWVLKDGGIYYPCLRTDKGVPGALPILRALIYKSWEAEGENLYALTSNTLIQRWVNLGAQTAEANRPADMPIATFTGDRVEWKHG